MKLIGLIIILLLITIPYNIFSQEINLLPNMPKGLVKENLGPSVNSQFDEMAPVISTDGTTLYFVVENHPDNIGGQNTDIWYSVFSNNQWMPRKNIGKPLNNENNNLIISVSADNNTLLLGNIYNDDGSNKGKGLSISTRTETGWSAPQELPIINFYNTSAMLTGCMSNDNKTLLLSIERDDTYGDNDLYVCFLQNNGKWSDPKNLGATINTFSNEITPFLAADGVTLYFSSNGRMGYGGYDVFLTRRLDSTWINWSEPQNLGPDINSKGGDAYYTIPASGKYAFIVSSTNSIGKGDIFKIKLPDFAKPKPVVLVYGKVLNSKTNTPIQANISYRDLSTDKELGTALSNPVDGSYKITLPAGWVYSFYATKDNFISISENIDIGKLDEYKELEKNLYLSPVIVGQTIRLNNIFFDFAKSELRPESFPELNRVVKLMNENSTMRIEVGGHTDDVGSPETNNILSQNRANAVRNYLILQGISESRIIAKGYGKTKPVASNETEEGKQQNRRVEFTILFLVK